MKKQEFIEKEKMNFKEQVDPECVGQNDEIKLQMKNELNEIIKTFYKNKEKLEYFKSIADIDNKAIKKKMQELDIKDFETDNGLTAKMSIQNRDKLNEEKAIKKLKKLGITSAIKTKEYIDMEELENQIYLGNLNPVELVDCQIKKEVITLKVTERKK